MSATKTKARLRALPIMPEVRHFKASGLEVRSKAKTNEIVISGRPIVYGASYRVVDAFGSFTETMAPGVARDVLARGADVRFLFNHDGLPMARSTAGTLTLRDTPSALMFSASLDARQQIANDLAVAIERGDVSSMSAGFIVARDEWDERQENRTIHQLASLLDISAVTYPASPTTSVQVAQRMALEVPVESRARLRLALADAAAGRTLSRHQLDVMRQIAGPETADSRSPRRPARSSDLHAQLAARGIASPARSDRACSCDARRRLATARARRPERLRSRIAERV